MPRKRYVPRRFGAASGRHSRRKHKPNVVSGDATSSSSIQAGSPSKPPSDEGVNGCSSSGRSSSSVQSYSTRRSLSKKIKMTDGVGDQSLLGRTIRHEWIEETNERKWYSGVIRQLLQGEEGKSDAVYGVSYSGDEELTNLTAKEIADDMASGSLHFIEGVPAGLWDMLRSMKADTAATALMVDRLVSRVVNLEELQDTSLAEKVDKLANTIDNLTARLAKNEKRTMKVAMPVLSLSQLLPSRRYVSTAVSSSQELINMI